MVITRKTVMKIRTVKIEDCATCEHDNDNYEDMAAGHNSGEND